MIQGISSCLLGVLALTMSTVVAAQPKTVRIEACLEAATAVIPGEYVKVEFLSPSAEGVPAYEIELRDARGREWELMCDAVTGRVFEIEQEAGSVDDPLFRGRARISEAQALETVRNLYPGVVREVEFEIESNGDPSYEIDIVNEDGTEFKIEVDAVSGAIIEVAVERWEIGEESSERR
jgi:uncharacterized membrane protein YkoI